MEMPEAVGRIVIRDVTLREGMDVPGVEFTFSQRLKIAEALSGAGIPEIEIVAPAKVAVDSDFAGICRDHRKQVRCKTSGLVYASGEQCFQELDLLSGVLDRIDILMPLSAERKPYKEDEKIARMLEVLAYGVQQLPAPGIGFPHAFHADPEFLARACREAEAHGAGRITIYDTDGSVDPFTVFSVIDELRQAVEAELFFHAHNDLGMATANSLAAVLAGANGLDVTVNGLGDRAGNASLEQVLLNMEMEDIETGISPSELKKLSLLVEEESGIPVHPLAPVVGEYVFSHKSPGHLGITGLFEAFDPDVLRRDSTSKSRRNGRK